MEVDEYDIPSSPDGDSDAIFQEAMMVAWKNSLKCGGTSWHTLQVSAELKFCSHYLEKMNHQHTVMADSATYAVMIVTIFVIRLSARKNYPAWNLHESFGKK